MQRLSWVMKWQLAALLFVCAATVNAAEPPIRPDPAQTPGAVAPVTAAIVCRRGYAKHARHVTRELRRGAYREYGIRPNGKAFEVDHLVPLEIGGSNNIKNLWPEARFTQPWNSEVKDRLERRLHALVCRGRLPLSVAQQSIAQDWIAAYKQYMPSSKIALPDKVAPPP